MNFKETLAQKKSAIIQKWIEIVLADYSADGASFFMKEKDRFANPLGFAAKSGLTAVFDQLIGEKPGQEIPSGLRQFVTLRSVQQFSPSAALSFVYQLKSILVAQMGQEVLLSACAEWFALEARIDALALKVFDLYMEDRERLYQVKANEFKKGNHIMAGARCPSNMTGNNQEEKIELKVIRDC